MDLLLNEQQRMLQAAVQELLRRDFPKHVLAAIDAGRESAASRWGALAATGVLGGLVPEEHGGAGGSCSDAGVVFEELGKGPVPGPAFSSGALAALIIAEAGDDAQRRAHLPGIASGERVFACAVTEPHAGWSPAYAAFDGAGGCLNGATLGVIDTEIATHFLVSARVDGGEAALVVVAADAPGVSARAVPGMATGLGELRLDGAAFAAEDVIAGGEAVGRAVLRATALLAASQVGGMDAVFAMSLAYSQTRRQFQQPIGRFQRVQDHIIDIVNHLDAARWATNEALWKLDTGRPAEASVHMAAALASEGYYLACNCAHDVHAGVGIVREYGLTLHTKMSRTLYGHLGSPRFHRRRIADALGL